MVAAIFTVTHNGLQESLQLIYSTTGRGFCLCHQILTHTHTQKKIQLKFLLKTVFPENQHFTLLFMVLMFKAVN